MIKVNKPMVLIAVLIIILGFIAYLTPQSPREIDIPSDDLRITLKQNKYKKAFELLTPDGYINIENINLTSIVGKKVILIDFWTYSCINCQRTFPYLKDWHSKYKDQGLQVIGIHTPEFKFEREYENVADAVKRFDLKYPVIMDNGYQNWKAFGNRYWPRKYLIDIDGFIVYDVIGEGKYFETEQKIKDLLFERSKVLEMNVEIDNTITSTDSVKPSLITTPEVYFGSYFARGNTFGNIEGLNEGKIVDYSLPKIKKNKAYVSGTWYNDRDYLQLASDEGKVVLNFNAKNVNVVAKGNSSAELYLDGEFINKVEFSEPKLYELIMMENSGNYILEIKLNNPGFRIYSFTFG